MSQPVTLHRHTETERGDLDLCLSRSDYMRHTETEQGDLDFCLSRSNYIDTQRQSRETLTSVSASQIT